MYFLRSILSVALAVLAAAFYYFGRRDGLLGVPALGSTGEVDVWLFLLQGIVATVALQDMFARFRAGKGRGEYSIKATSWALACLLVFHLALAGLRVALRSKNTGPFELLISGSGALATSLFLTLLAAFALAAFAEFFLVMGNDGHRIPQRREPKKRREPGEEDSTG